MSALLTDFHFLRPAWLVLLVLLPLAWWLLGRRARGGGDWERAVDPHLLPHLLERSPGRAGRASQWLALGAALLFVLALAGPAWERMPEPLQRQEAALVIALDLSPSARATDLKPDRLIRARYKLADLFRLRPDGQTALVAYAGEPFTVAPLTDDSETIANLIDALDPTLMPVPGQRADLALLHAESLLRGAGLERGDVLLIAGRADARAAETARELAARGVRVSVLGLGGSRGAPVLQPGGGFLLDADGRPVLARLESAGLEAVARAGGGRFAAFSADASDLRALQLDQVASGVLRATSAQATRWRDAGWWLLPPLLLLTLLGFRRGWLALVLVAPLALPTPAQAFGWRDLWQRPDQQAAAALRAGDAEQARELAHDPALRGAAAYRAEDWAAAAEDFARGDDATAHYNRGNALAKAGNFEAALQAYDAALAQRPELEDARANREAVRAWLEQQQKQQDGESEGGESSESDPQSAQDGEGEPQSQPPDSPESGEDAGGEGEPADPQPPQSSDSEGQDQGSAASGEGEESEPVEPPAKSESEAAQQALREAIDQALAEQDADDGERVDAAAADESAAEREQRQSVEQWLRRVPDDPGALLRRKFALEHQRRQREGQR